MADSRIPSSGVKGAKGTKPAKPVGKAAEKPAPAPAQPVNNAAPAKPKAPTAGADSTIAKGLGTGNLHDLEALLDSAVAITAPAAEKKVPAKNPTMALIEETLQFPPKPSDPADQKAWLMDGYRRLLKAETAFGALENEWKAGKVDGNALSMGRSKLWNAQRLIGDADKGGVAKKEFFEAILPPAKAIIDGLADFPAPPADKAGKKAWLAEGKQKLAEAQAANQLMKDAWFDFKALEFDKMSDAGSKIWNFEGRLRQVDRELNPPPPAAPRKPGQPGSSGPSGPLFGNTQGVSDALNKHPNNPVVQVGGAIALPIALTIDVLDAITRPFVWLDKVSNGGK
jgi:hypothetical protein